MSRARAGFTLVEVIVTMVVLLVAVLSLVGSSRVVASSVRRATVELRAAQLVQDEVERLRTLPLDSLADGAAVHPGGASAWVVQDSGAYLRMELIVATAPLAGASVIDTLYVYRAR